MGKNKHKQKSFLRKIHARPVNPYYSQRRKQIENEMETSELVCRLYRARIEKYINSLGETESFRRWSMPIDYESKEAAIQWMESPACWLDFIQGEELDFIFPMTSEQFQVTLGEITTVEATHNQVESARRKMEQLSVHLDSKIER